MRPAYRGHKRSHRVVAIGGPIGRWDDTVNAPVVAFAHLAR